jgi:hypothetical protein
VVVVDFFLVAGAAAAVTTPFPARGFFHVTSPLTLFFQYGFWCFALNFSIHPAVAVAAVVAAAVVAGAVVAGAVVAGAAAVVCTAEDASTSQPVIVADPLSID